MTNKFLLSIAAFFAILSCSTNSKQVQQIKAEDAIVYELNIRQYTPEGTFAAAAKRLPFLKELGVDIVWVMPPYPIGELNRKGTLGSYYAIKDYCDINPEFGTLEDFDAFIATAHELGLKVIFDWVGNHTAPDHPWVTEKPADWYVRDDQGNTIIEYDWDDIAKLNTANPDVVEAEKQAMLFWVKRGLDGFRCDVAYQLSASVWNEIIPSLREEYGSDDFYMLAEGEETWLPESGFDATYSWKLHHLLNDISQGKADIQALTEYIDWDAQNYNHNGKARLCFTSNHDENSWSGTEFERMGEAWKAMTILCWTLPNSQPLIYTAQEIGYDHRFEFFEKDAIPEYKTNAITDFYRYLCELKHNHPALSASEGEFELISSDNNTIVYKRTAGNDKLKISVQLESPWAWSIESESDFITSIEPPCWWVGMQTPLQLMIHGDQIASYDLSLEAAESVKIKEIHKAESPNYLFVDLEIAKNAKAGTFNLVFTKGDKKVYKSYTLHNRREASAQRESFGTADAIYLIMPDRYVNSDPSNDHLSCMRDQSGLSDPFGRHGGDLQGIIDQLDYIADLGFTAIWNTPVQEDNVGSSSYHGYACSNYYKIDPRFGGNYKYREFVREAHKRGIKVIMDVVTNHSANVYWWMEDLPFADWIHQWDEYTHSNCSFTIFHDPYCAEADFKNMQEGWFDTSMVDMNLDNPFVLKYMIQMYTWWMEWADIDGLRIDTVPYNEPVPLSHFCKAIRTEYPNINIVGEVWSQYVHQIAYWQADNPNLDGFNSNMPSVMDFPLHSAITSTINVDSENWDEGFQKIYNSIANDGLYKNLDNMMVFCGNHDTDHIGDITGGDPAKMKLIFALIATVRGYPQIFAGDEVILRASDIRQGDGGRRNMFELNWAQDPAKKDVHDYVAALFNWRKGSKAVQQGMTKHYINRDNHYDYFRYTEEELIFVFANNNAQARTVDISAYPEFEKLLSEAGRDVISGKEVLANGTVVPAKSALILEYKLK